MTQNIRKFLSEEKERLAQYSLDTDRAYNRYIIFGSAASLTLVVNLVGKNPDLFSEHKYMDIALWCLAVAILISGACLFLNARLADFALDKYTKGIGFLLGYEGGANDSDFVSLDKEAQEEFNKILGLGSGTFKIVRRTLISFEVLSGVMFSVAVLTSIYELGVLL